MLHSLIHTEQQFPFCRRKWDDVLLGIPSERGPEELPTLSSATAVGWECTPEQGWGCWNGFAFYIVSKSRVKIQDFQSIRAIECFLHSGFSHQEVPGSGNSNKLNLYFWGDLLNCFFGFQSSHFHSAETLHCRHFFLFLGERFLGFWMGGNYTLSLSSSVHQAKPKQKSLYSLHEVLLRLRSRIAALTSHSCKPLLAAEWQN